MRVAIIAAAIALASSPALASPSCMTQSEARAKFPKEHLWWRGPNRCWDATPPSRQRLAQRIKAREAKQAQREARAERDAPEETKLEEKKKSGWANEPRWREAMSRMRPEDMLAIQAPTASASASAEALETPPPRSNFWDRWVDIAPRAAPMAAKPGPADLAANARAVEPVVTPVRVMLALLVLLLTLGCFELLRRPVRRAD